MTARRTQQMRYVPKHPLAPPSGFVAVARLALYDKIGAGPHACNWCGCEIEWMPGKGLAEGALVADHLNWDRKDDSPENLVPSCNTCNAHRTRAGDRSRIEEGELVVFREGKRRRAVEHTCKVCGTVFVSGKDAVGLTCSRRCSGIVGARNRWG